MQLSVIIVNYNVKYFLEQCICSVIKTCKNIDTEIFVIDNNSTDGSKEFFNGKFPQVKFIWNSENVGYAKANNQVIDQCSGEFILFLNPDMLLPEDCFEECLLFIQRQQNVGALGIRLIDGSGKFLKESKRGFPSPSTSFFKLTGLTSLFPHSKLFAHYYLGNLNEQKTYEVDVLVGAFMLIPKAVLNKVGYFDEQFFMYAEDIDLSYRIQKAGFKNYYFPETTAIHFKGESTNKDFKYIKLFYKAMSIFAKKHYSGGNAGLFNILIQIGIWMRATISGIANIFKRIFSFNSNKKENAQAVIFANENEYNLLISSFKKNNSSIKIVGRISSIDEIKNYAANEIIFCEGEYFFKEIIEIIQRTSINVSFYFHANGSHSIIGSNDKGNSGEVIGLQ